MITEKARLGYLLRAKDSKTIITQSKDSAVVRYPIYRVKIDARVEDIHVSTCEH